jgi:hypothetical protein
MGTITIYVGGKGKPGIASGGFNGGGDCTLVDSASGGGATDIRMFGTELAHRKIVAGGGGGGDSYCKVTAETGYGGNPGASGSVLPQCNHRAAGGGTQSAGGNGGLYSLVLSGTEEMDALVVALEAVVATTEEVVRVAALAAVVPAFPPSLTLCTRAT